MHRLFLLCCCLGQGYVPIHLPDFLRPPDADWQCLLCANWNSRWWILIRCPTAPPYPPPGVINVFATQLEFTAHEIQNCEERLRKIVEKGVISSNNTPRVVHCLSAMLIFEAELAYRMSKWQVIPKVIQVCIPSSFAHWGFSNQLLWFWQKVAQCQASPSDTFEAITDMLVSVPRSGENNLPNYTIPSGPPRAAPRMVRICGAPSTSADSTYTVLFVALEVLSILLFPRSSSSRSCD